MNTKKIDEFIKNKIKELKLPYFYCLVKKENKVIYTLRYSHDDNDMLRMYSMSKPITAVAIMQLYEKGQLDIYDNVAKYLKGYDDLKLIDGSKVDKPITIYNLLTMTSGLDYNLNRKEILKLKEKDNNASTVKICEVMAKDGLLFTPGSDYQYSLSFDVLAAITEKVSKQKFSTYVKENIFKPLGMNNSTFVYNPILSKKCVDEYINKDKKLVKIKPLYEGFFPTKNYESSGAGLISTVKDYSLFISSLANRENKILKDESVDLMSKVYVQVTPFNEAVQEYSKASNEYGYGFGVRVRKVKSKNIPIGEFGWDGATGSYSLCDRKNKISIVMGLSIASWPNYLKDFHIVIAKEIYQEIFSI